MVGYECDSEDRDSRERSGSVLLRGKEESPSDESCETCGMACRGG
jgi:hypothetical protein